ncbi:hypothetical protein IFM51744_06257 [Aspergillus udagawae]|uniref:Uncharacterized protein n=1 Tax=Aspergillus udagawae TaxID=91492 RepID=A0A8H3P5J7_9EURO|nr:uncharacterized protein Aud_003702 [Aspergillus udagawae]GFF46184.1 hypothetical protein IFM51744_06257 [Aspergillus udagawae]GFF85899.1 hypothetical protein IFM53868_04635 [Aspergillus udagawae]GFG02555.1 hypothetical protein IFM5058_00994 [Aspergillus udagawae]GIC87318.1 hypothetical protein Aud_003702 [Aspergillus udagawae]
MATTTSSVNINFYGELRQLWVEINSHCERLHLLDSTTRVLSACIECKITPYGMVPLDIDGLENADEYVMQLVLAHPEKICGPEFPVGPIISFVDSVRMMCEPVSGSAQVHITAIAVPYATQQPDVAAPGGY